MIQRRGFSLVEVLVVTAIIVTLLAVLGLAIAPSIKRKGWQARIGADLKQISMAERMYMSDYDDSYAPSLEVLAARIPGTPTKPPTSKGQFPECDPTGEGIYILTRNYSIAAGEQTYTAMFPFDINVNPIVKAPFFCRRPGTKEEFTHVLNNGGGTQRITREVFLVLGARLDGSVGWFNFFDEWEDEFAARRRF